jgi:hypothetical protein
MLTKDKMMIKKYLKKIPVFFRLFLSLHAFLFILDDQLSSITSVYRRFRLYYASSTKTQFEKGRIIGAREAGLSSKANAQGVGRNVTTVLRCCRAWFEDQCY